jgi:hypothetical protein
LERYKQRLQVKERKVSAKVRKDLALNGHKKTVTMKEDSHVTGRNVGLKSPCGATGVKGTQRICRARARRPSECLRILWKLGK